VFNTSTIPYELLQTKGRGVKVGVCDTGCDIRHEAISHAIKGYKSFFETQTDHNQHGTHVCGIIAGRGKVRGIAPNCELYVAKTMSGRESHPSYFIKALDWMIEKQVDVINLSFAFNRQNIDIYDKICELTNNKVIVNAAFTRDLKYPHSYDEVISVSGYDKGEVIRGGKIDILAPANIFSASPNQTYRFDRGTSMSTAYITGIAALAKSCYGKDMGKEEFISALKNPL